MTGRKASTLRKRCSRPAFFGQSLLLATSLLLASCAAGDRPPRGIARPQGPVPDMPVKIGKPYQVAGVWYYPADARDYDEVGLASWYGGKFHDGPTANGERFDMDRIGAAHTTLPLPSYVEVTALDTGRTILVRVNDRGPFVANRIIDLSRRAAQLLGIERAGVSPVRVRRVEPSEADRLALRWGRPAADRPRASADVLARLNERQRARPVATAPTGHYIQIAALGDRLRAEGLASLLSARLDYAGGLWRIRLGPYSDEPSASEALARVQAQGYQDARLIRAADSNRPPEWNQPR